VEVAIVVTGIIGVVVLGWIFCLARKTLKEYEPRHFSSAQNPSDNQLELEKIISGDKWGLIHALIVVYSILVIMTLGVFSLFLPKFQLPEVLGAVLGVMGAGFAHALGKPKNPGK
jgi:uncharacterized membrane protein YkvI